MQVLGISLTQDQATVVHVDGRKGPAAITNLFSVSCPQDAEDSRTLFQLLGEAIAARGLIFEEAALAVGSELYAQYPMHSMFTDFRQIEGTIKFDAEEVTAADALTQAVTFDILKTGPNGSDVLVYSADRQALADVLLDLQAQGIDPTIMEPDQAALSRMLEEQYQFSDYPDSIYAILTENGCALLKAGQQGHAPQCRRFLMGIQADPTKELSGQIHLSAAAWFTDQPMQKIIIAGHTEKINTEQLEAMIGHPVEVLALELPNQSLLQTEESMSSVQASIAWGTALGLLKQRSRTDFRRDFMPYQGRRRIVQNSLRIMSVALTVVLLTIGAFYQFKTFRMQGYTRKLKSQLIEGYKDTMYGQRPNENASIIRKLENEYRKARVTDSPLDDSTITAKIQFILEAINKMNANADIQIQQLSITDKTMTLKGDMNSHQYALGLSSQLKNHPKLTVVSEQITPSLPRYSFSFNLEIKD